MAGKLKDGSAPTEKHRCCVRNGVESLKYTALLQYLNSVTRLRTPAVDGIGQIPSRLVYCSKGGHF